MSGAALALWLTNAWVRCYTRGLEPGLRAERRAELQSDIWEQLHERALTPGPSPRGRGEAASQAWLVLLRCVLGMPADISWRLEQAAPGAVVARVVAGGLMRVANAGHWVTARGLPGLSVLMSWLYLLAGALIIVTLPISRNPNPGGVAVFGAWCIAAGAMMWWGNGMLERRPYRGAGLVLAGSLPLGLALWMTVIVPVATAGVGWSTVQRARRGKRTHHVVVANGSYLPIISRELAAVRRRLAEGVRAMAVNVLAYGEGLLAPASADGETRKRDYVLKGAAVGLTVGILARIWMRTISQDPQFSVGGTGLIFIVFAGLGALTGLSIAWRQLGTQRRMLVVRGVAWAPYLLMGPFMLLFLPGLGLALLRSHGEWSTRRRRAVKWGAWGLLGFVVLIMLGAEQGPGLVAAGLYLVVAWALYFTNRVALSSRSAAMGPPSPGDRWWSRQRQVRSSGFVGS
jgi:hypothetical protein